MHAQIQESPNAICAADKTELVSFLRPPNSVSFRSNVFWRIFDVLLASIILVATLPCLVLFATLLYFSDPGPLFFVHRRIGYRGKFFGCLKFRTMRVDGDSVLQAHLASSPAALREWVETQKLKDDPRVSKVGAIVRKLSLDEFPQLINVIRGEMSIVGPRPIVEAEVERYGQYFEFYTHVKPGLTGLWQISGRSDTSYRRRVQLDVEYVARKSLQLDILLLVKTIPAVLLAKGSY